MDELGSGVLNVNKYLPVYAPGKKPQFIEGNSFKMIIPLDEKMITKFTVSDGTVNDRVSDRVNKGVSEGRIEGMSAGIKGKLLETPWPLKSSRISRLDWRTSRRYCHHAGDKEGGHKTGFACTGGS